jgi:YaiO family outer membrane protein
MILTALLLLTPAGPADTAVPRPWRAETSYAVDWHRRDRTAWQTARMAIGRRLGSATVIGEALTAARFDQWDQALAGEAYVAIRPRLSGYARVQAAPSADVLPTTDLSGELTRGLSGGWEVSAGYRRMGFELGAVHIVGLSAARYAGHWYLQARGTMVPRGGLVGLGLGLRARRYFDPDRPDQFIELYSVAGKEVILPDPGLDPDVRGTTSAGARLQRRVGAGWGVTAMAGWTRESRSPSRVGVGAGLYLTW